MILHLLHSDNATGRQFAEYVIGQFSSPEMCSEFAIISDSDVKDSFLHQERIHFINLSNKDLLLCLIKSLSEYSALVLHGVFYPWCELILKSVPDKVKVAWMFWGGEIYDRDMSFLAPLTRRLTILHGFIKRKKDNPSWSLPKELFQRIDYCLTGEKEEYEYAKEYVQSTQMQHIWYTYYSMEETLGDLFNQYSSGNSVWLCNSASVENNVFDAVAKLSYGRNRKHLRGRKVIMPLSYGSGWVRNAMIKIGPHFFKSGFLPLVEFLPRKEYNRMMLDCSTMILPYYRPAAQGNILTALWLGMRVYLSEKSMSYLFFRRLGVNVFSFESDFNKYGCLRLSKGEIEQNRQILRTWYGKDHVDEACRNVVAALR